MCAAEQSPDELVNVAAAFDTPGRLVRVEPFTGGHIHASYRLTYADSAGTEAGGRRPHATTARPRQYLLQRINTTVFSQPALILENMSRVLTHIAAHLDERGISDRTRRVLTIVPTRAGELRHTDAHGGCWRMLVYIEGTRSLLSPDTPAQAEAAARAFGEFQRLLTDLPPPRLHETIPDFHNTPLRFAAFERAVAADTCRRVSAVQAEIEACRRRRPLADTLLDLHRRGAIPERIVHNDAKLSNVLFDAITGEALCVVDLDTVMPGLSLYDFGDMVRSMSCTAAEDEQDCTRVAVEPELFAALARGYCSAATEFLTPAERANLVTAGKLITLEQAVRFLTDYVCGDTYYHIERPAHNVERCRAQLALLESLERHTLELERAVRPG